MSEKLADVDLSKPPEPQNQEEDTQEEKQPQEEVKTVDQALRAYAGAPSNNQLEQWKQQFGEVLCSGFSETELFVFRPLRRDEFVNLQAYVAQQGASQYEVEEKTVRECVLWASESGVTSMEAKAGTLNTLYEQVLQASNFMNPAMAASYVVRL